VLTIGLICEHTLAFGAIDHLIDKANVPYKDVAYFRFKSKRFSGWPGDGYVRTWDGSEYCVPNKERLSIKDIYTPARCRLCFDKMNVLSDLVVGDPWGVRQDKEGYSVVIARTQQGQDALLSARDAGAVQLDPIEPEDIFRGQGIDRKRKEWASFMSLWKQTGGTVPDFGMDTRWIADGQNISLKPYSKKLKWAKYLASKDSKSEVLKAVKRHLRFRRLRRALTPKGMTGFMLRCLNRLKEKLS
jgi:coenzyme F420 hydrogenase subunit beta